MRLKNVNTIGIQFFRIPLGIGKKILELLVRRRGGFVRKRLDTNSFVSLPAVGRDH
jgi:hypothetical protein